MVELLEKSRQTESTALSDTGPLQEEQPMEVHTPQLNDEEPETPAKTPAPTREIQVGVLAPLPFVDERKMRLNVPLYEEVTSLDLTPDGCYVLAGCASGAVLLFDLTNAKRTEEIGRIRAKGLHTSVRVTVCVSEDSRFVFAGVLRGSVEMLAIDISRLPSWDEDRSRGSALANLLVPYTYADAKLKGFGAVTRRRQDHPEHGPEYKLLCGRSIRNIHIWRFCPDSPAKPHWELLFDIPSNGNTIEVVGFQNDSHAFSKSKHQPLRLWNLDYGTEPARAKKLDYVDISNTQDMYAVAGEFAFGGVYEFSVVNLDGAGWVNRTEMALPAPADEPDAGAGSSRRRRVCREINGVVCSQDGKHILAACTDGSLVYYNGRTCTTPILLPDMEVRDTYAAISRVGSNGVVTVAAVVPSEHEGEFHLRVSALSGILGDRRLQESDEYAPAWPKVYRSVSPVVDTTLSSVEDKQPTQQPIETATAKEAEQASSASPPATTKKEGKRSAGRPRYQTPATRPASGQPRAKITPSTEARVLATPNRRASSDPQQFKAHKRARTETPQVPVVLALSTSPSIDDVGSSPREDLDFEGIDSTQLIETEPMVPSPPAIQVQRMQFTAAIQPAETAPLAFKQFLRIRDEFLRVNVHPAQQPQVPSSPLRFKHEHDRVRATFYESVDRIAMHKVLAALCPDHNFRHSFSILHEELKKHSHGSSILHKLQQASSEELSFPSLLQRTSSLIRDMLQRQNAELRAAAAVLALGQTNLRLAADHRIEFEGKKQMVDHSRQFLEATDRLIAAMSASTSSTESTIC